MAGPRLFVLLIVLTIASHYYPVPAEGRLLQQTEPCPPGSYPFIVPSDNSTIVANCTLCPTGTRSPTGTNCTACPMGFTTTGPGATTCNACIPGRGSRRCTRCKAGTFSLGMSLAACRPCRCGTPGTCRVVTCDAKKGCVTKNAPARTACLSGISVGQCTVTGNCQVININAPGADGACKSIPAAPASINTKSKADVTLAFLSQVYPHFKCSVYGFLHSSCCAKPKFPGSTASCSVFNPSTGWQEEVRKVINFFRLMTGVPVITFTNATRNEANLQGALMCTAQQYIAHVVGPSDNWRCYSARASLSVLKSNLAIGKSGAQAVIGYMYDPGANNVEVGHRRWLQLPNSKVMANGDAWPDKWGQINNEVGPLQGSIWMPANNIWTVDDDTYFSQVDPSAPILQLKPFPFFSWPPAGAFVPHHLVFPRWHFSLEGFGYETSETGFWNSNILGAAKVSMTVKVGAAAATPLAVTVITAKPKFLVFEPTLPWDPACAPRCNQQHLKAPAADTTYTVTVSGFSFKGVTSLSYDVIVFSIPSAPVYDPSPVASAAAADLIDESAVPEGAIAQQMGWFQLGDAPAAP